MISSWTRTRVIRSSALSSTRLLVFTIELCQFASNGPLPPHAWPPHTVCSLLSMCWCVGYVSGLSLSPSCCVLCPRAEHMVHKPLEEIRGISLFLCLPLFLFLSSHNVTLIIQPCVTAWQSRKICASLCARCLPSCADWTCPARFLLRVCRNKVINFTD